VAEQGWRGSWLVTAALLAVVPHALRAQQSGPAPEAVWALDTLRSGFCINFLVDPAIAAQRTFRGVTPVPASSAESLHPALRLVVESSPEFSAWIPEQFCILQFSSVRIGSRVLRDTKHGRPQVVGMWAMSAAPGAQGSVALLTGTSRLSSSVKYLGMGVDVIKTAFGKVPESTDDRYEIRYSGTTLTWDGHASGDSTAAPVMDREWTAAGRNGRVLRIHERLDAAGARMLVGALRVEGKGELARALTGSPIRYVGPLVWGGSGSITFTP
jgi:hypothetical protein